MLEELGVQERTHPRRVGPHVGLQEEELALDDGDQVGVVLPGRSRVGGQNGGSWGSSRAPVGRSGGPTGTASPPVGPPSSCSASSTCVLDVRQRGGSGSSGGAVGWCRARSGGGSQGVGVR